jgi:hypothetical protein
LTFYELYAHDQGELRYEDRPKCAKIPFDGIGLFDVYFYLKSRNDANMAAICEDVPRSLPHKIECRSEQSFSSQMADFRPKGNKC